MPTYSYTNGTVNTQGTEKDFISTFIKQFMHETAFSSLHTLECKIGTTMGGSPYTVSLTEVTTDTEVDNQIASVFSSSNSSNKPTFSFKIDDCATLIFTRANTWGSVSTAQPYKASGDFFGTSVSGQDDTLAFTSSNFTGNRYKYQIVWNANVIYVVFGLYNEDFPLTVRRSGQSKDRNYQAFCYKKNSDKICGLHAGETLYDNSNRIVSLKNRIEYVNSSNPTDIETIQNKAVICNSDKVLVAENIWDSSYSGVLMLPVNVIANNQSHTGIYLNNYTVVPLLEME